MDALILTKPEGKNSAGECFTNVVYDSGPECAMDVKCSNPDRFYGARMSAKISG